MYIEEYVIQLDGTELRLRNAREEDAEMLIDYLKQTCGETRFLVKEPEEITLTIEQEKNFIRNQNESEGNLMLLAFLNGKYIGNCSLMGNAPSRYRHRASVGIALFQAYTGMGIGRKMLELLCEIAKEKGIEQLELEVVADNDRAIALYKKIGFEKMGTFPHNMKVHTQMHIGWLKYYNGIMKTVMFAFVMELIEKVQIRI